MVGGPGGAGGDAGRSCWFHIAIPTLALLLPELSPHATGLDVATRVAVGASAPQVVFLGAHGRLGTG